jgi:hypothetical protein
VVVACDWSGRDEDQKHFYGGFEVLTAAVMKCSVYSFACYLLHAAHFFGLVFDPENGGDVFFRTVGLIFNRPHSVISRPRRH